MKNIIFLFLFFSLIAQSQSKITLTVGKRNFFHTPTFTGTLVDDGYYNGYSFVDQHSDGMLSDLYKKTASHTSVGPLMLMFSYDGGTTWNDGQVYVDGVAAQAVALWKVLLPSGRMLIGFQDDIVYRYVKFAYSDNPESRQFTGLVTYDFGGTDISSPCPIPGVIMPSGKVKFYYYKLENYYNPGPYDHFKVGAIVTTDEGVSYHDDGEVILNNSADYPDSLGYWKAHETTVVITDNTGVDATTKMVAWARVNIPNEGGTYFAVYRSANGGATWTTDLTQDAGSFVDDNGNTQSGPFSRYLNYTFLAGNNPARLIAHGGYIYAVVGERNIAGGYKLKWSRASPAGAYRNKWDDWERPHYVRTYNATTLGSSIDCGYPCPYEQKAFFGDTTPQLWYHDYDTSTEPDDPLLSDGREWIFQGKIDN